jgi:hypothetical protein
MRLLLEIIVIGALIALAWEKSFKDWASEAPIIGPRITAQSRTHAPSPQPSPERPVPAETKSFTGHIFYVDEQGKKYWLDAKGLRHYEP